MNIQESHDYLDSMVALLGGSLKTARELSYDKPAMFGYEDGRVFVANAFISDQQEGLVFEAHCRHGEVFGAMGFAGTIEEATVQCAHALMRTLGLLFPEGLGSFKAGDSCPLDCELNALITGISEIMN